MRQVVIDSFWDADDAHVPAAFNRFLMNLVGRILGIIAARIKEKTDVVRFKDLEDPVEIARGLFWFPFVVYFVSARA